MLWYSEFAAPITSSGKRLCFLRPYSLLATAANDISNSHSEHLTRQSGCNLEFYNRQTCFLLRQKLVARGSSPANEYQMQGPDVLTELPDCQHQHLRGACKSAASENTFILSSRYSVSCSTCKLGFHSSAIA